MASRMTAKGEGGKGVQGLSTKEKDSWMWTTVWGLWGERGVRGD